MKNSQIPKFAHSALWSYDLEELDLSKHKQIIIKNVLDYGTKPAIDWLRDTYSRDDIKKVIRTVPASAWGKKSLALWTLIYKVEPEHQVRYVG